MTKEKLHAFIEIAGLETEEEFYAKYPTEEDFFKEFPEAREQFNFGGLIGSAVPNIAQLIMSLAQGNKSTDPMDNEAYKNYQAYKNNPGTIYSPDQALAENEMMIAQAKLAADNPLTQTLDMVGQLGMSYGTDMMGQEGNFEGWGKKEEKAFGGGVGNVPVEVEGDEIAQLPQGGLMEFKGPRHEQGGVPVELPSGTHVFSDRIKIDGITTAERKKRRDKKEKKLEKTFADNITDILVRNALERTKEVNQQEELFDINLQDEVDNYMNSQEEEISPEQLANELAPEAMMMEQFKWGGDILYNKNMMDVISKIQSGEIKKTPGGDDGGGENKSFFKDGSSTTTTMGDILKNNPYSAATMGDLIGLAGNAYQAYAPMRTTLEQRAGDTPNINYYSDYGQEGLKTLQQSKDFARENKDRVKQELELSRVANAKRNRNSARGVNTMRALDIAGDMQMDSAERGIETDFANQMLSILGQESQMQNQIDQVVMAGEQQRDENDRHDRGQFFSNLGEDRVSLGEGISRTGKSLNQIQTNTVNEEMLNNLSDSVKLNIKNGKVSAKVGIQTLASINRSDDAFKVFEENEEWKNLGYKNKKEWDALSKSEKDKVFREYLKN